MADDVQDPAGSAHRQGEGGATPSDLPVRPPDPGAAVPAAEHETDARPALRAVRRDDARPDDAHDDDTGDGTPTGEVRDGVPVAGVEVAGMEVGAAAAGAAQRRGPAGRSSSSADGTVRADARGDAWFETLVREHATAVHRYLVRRVDRSDVEDLTADVLTVAWRRRDDVPDGAELPWLYRTAGYVVANHRRKGRPVPVADVPDEVDPDDPAVRAVRDEAVRTVLAGLSSRDREVLLLHAWEGLTGDGLAAALGIGRGGADAALSRARSRLRAAFDADL